MGDQAEVSHQLRTSDDHTLRLGCGADGGYSLRQAASIGLGPVRLLQRAPHLRCGARLFVPLAGPWRFGKACVPVAGGVASGAACASALLMVGISVCAAALRGAGDMPVRAGTFDAVGDGNPVPVRVGCSRLERAVPGRVGCPRRRLGCGRLRLPRKRAICVSPSRPPAWNCRESGWETWDASGPHPHKRPMSDKPDLSLVHLGGVQGSGILCGNRSTSYSGRRISDRSG